ncbi:hypothetical protein CO180_00500 [candidate division WWE3 bacterium CG_4_9_14_3_um_filter_41_6]|uniref:Peptidase M19 n=1 Tax=candidate division WWE3 bacterium CG_4_10_14_0_2_um_filter_41_14 TaxID=1975072 RepID=A0A2M7TG98_UNCKA|nr:MAG: hypothetical protein COY32_05720 [candidate division WWE3 bacterium CG_4_10_14_0_2_um_filter_41_14]PJA39536.1 MAG: hypothetical protein CO180_00500 [candidate division WWE3 bacterium CG_4_9_14_3_um_filter_41_6]
MKLIDPHLDVASIFDEFKIPIDDFYHFYKLGVRSFGLSWEDKNEYVSGNSALSDEGVSAKGRDMLRIMGTKKLMVDTAHLGDRSFRDLDRLFEGVIVNTHANVRTITDSKHNLTDDQIQIIVDHGGIVCVFPIKEDVGGNATFDDWYKHVDYIASKWGVEYVGLCSDIFPLPEYPFVNDAQNMTVLKDFQMYLLTRLDPILVQKISHDNFYNVLKRCVPEG